MWPSRITPTTMTYTKFDEYYKTIDEKMAAEQKAKEEAQAKATAEEVTE